MSYYKTIDGKKYDRALLEKAEALIEGQGDGRISAKDAQTLAQSICDGRGITDIEKDTLMHIFKKHKWTDKGFEWFKNESPIVDPEIYQDRVNDIFKSLDLEGMELKSDLRSIEEMNCRYPSPTNFYVALEQALENMLSTTKADSPLYEVGLIVNNFYEIQATDFDDEGDWEDYRLDVLKSRMRAGYIQVVPEWEKIKDKAPHIPIPDQKEASKDHWVFYLGIETDDHRFWTIVPREKNKEAYTYGIH